MERLKYLDGYQKGILILLFVMAVVYAGIYSAVIFREGYRYQDEILVPEYEADGTVRYSGEIGGFPSSFTVTADKEVIFRYGNATYGPYTAVEDPTAIPENDQHREYMTGIEVRKQGEILFRGGIRSVGGQNGHWIMVDENGSLSDMGVYVVMSNGTVIDGNGKTIDPMEPSVSDVLHLMQGPELSHKGDWYAWLGGLLISAVTVVTMLFADELFRLGLIFRVRNVEQVEPSDWEISSRYAGWTVLTVAAFVIYITGLQ